MKIIIRLSLTIKTIWIIVAIQRLKNTYLDAKNKNPHNPHKIHVLRSQLYNSTVIWISCVI